MQRIANTLRTQWLGALGILIGLTGVAFGATGQPALLGKLNQADKPTVFQNTAGGPAVAFKGDSGAPPFTVDSRAQVPRLNAARLGGRLPSSFARAGSSYTKAESDALFGDGGEVTQIAEFTSGGTFVKDGALFSHGFAPNVSGTLTLRVFGQCSSEGIPGSLVVSLDPGTRTTPIEAPACENSHSTHLGAGEFRFLEVLVKVNASFDPVLFSGGVAVVTFVPD